MFKIISAILVPILVLLSSNLGITVTSSNSNFIQSFNNNSISTSQPVFDQTPTNASPIIIQPIPSIRQNRQSNLQPKNNRSKKFDYCGIEGSLSQRTPEKPFGYNFAPSCKLHDECYRVAETKQSISEINSAKRICDTKLKQNLYKYCNSLESNPRPITNFSLRFRLTKFGCRRTADTYYFAVRNYQNRLIKRQVVKETR